MRKTLLTDVLSKLADKAKGDLANLILDRKNQEPWILVFGKKGAGKSTLINHLFDPTPKQKVGYEMPITSRSKTSKLDLGKDRGRIRYTDISLISKITASEKNEKIIESLQQCDIALWLFKIDDTILAVEREFISSLPAKLKKKIIFCLSQCDLADGGNWNSRMNTPSKKQVETILNRIQYLSQEINVPSDKLLEFSVHKEYNTNLLRKIMIMSIDNKSDILMHKIKGLVAEQEQE